MQSTDIDGNDVDVATDVYVVRVTAPGGQITDITATHDAGGTYEWEYTVGEVQGLY